MNTFKTAVVVVVLLGMGYGGWMLLSGKWELVTKDTGSSVLPDGITPVITWPDTPGVHPGDPSATLSSPATAVGGEAPPFDPRGGIRTADYTEADSGSSSSPSAGSPPGGPVADAKRGLNPFPDQMLGPPGTLPEPPLGPLAEPPRPSFGAQHLDAQPTAPEVAVPAPSPYQITAPPTGGLSGVAAREPERRATTSTAFAASWRSALEALEDDHLQQALYGLSSWIGSPDLTPAESTRLERLLDELAGTVIYSTEHLMEPAYTVRLGERLQDIAAQYHVPWELLAHINGISNPDVLLPGQRLKVIEGPFSARVDLNAQQIILYLHGHYAGRFSCTPGRDQPPQPGEYRVVGKVVERSWYDPTGRELPPDHPDNPYGKYWIDLGSNQSIHAVALSGPGRGCIGVTSRDAQDLYAVLSPGSLVYIR